MNGHSREVIEYLREPLPDEEEYLEDLATCDCCKRDFPEELLQPYVSGGSVSPDSCPICALGLSNIQHGMNRTEFNGTMANEMLRESRAYLIKHPQISEYD